MRLSMAAGIAPEKRNWKVLPRSPENKRRQVIQLSSPFKTPSSSPLPFSLYLSRCCFHYFPHPH
jgi:hypothetical protein